MSGEKSSFDWAVLHSKGKAAQSWAIFADLCGGGAPGGSAPAAAVTPKTEHNEAEAAAPVPAPEVVPSAVAVP
eukprot:2899797-Alexandrium_andersonii.AAC.1